MGPSIPGGSKIFNLKRKENKMKDKNSQNKSASVQILGTTKALTSEAADENLFEFIKKEFPDIQANSLCEFNFYIYTDSEDKVMKCAKFINQGIASTTKYVARLIVSKYESSDGFGIVITFMGFPFSSSVSRTRGSMRPNPKNMIQKEKVHSPPKNNPDQNICCSVLARKPMIRWVTRVISIRINKTSIRVNLCISSLSLLRRRIKATPVDNPDTRKKGPRIDVFQIGRALNALNSIPV